MITVLLQQTTNPTAVTRGVRLYCLQTKHFARCVCDPVLILVVTAFNRVHCLNYDEHYNRSHVSFGKHGHWVGIRPIRKSHRVLAP